MAEKLIEYLDKLNKSLKNVSSKDTINKLLETIPFLIEEEHFECTKRLLKRAEGQNKRLGMDYQTTAKILKLWIDLESSKPCDEKTPNKEVEKYQIELILLYVDHDDLKSAATIYLDL